MGTTGDDRGGRPEQRSRVDPISDALVAFFDEHRFCGVLESAADNDKNTFSLTCRYCNTSLVLPMS